MSCIYLKDTYVHIPIIKHHAHFLHFVWQKKPDQRKVLPSGLAMVLKVFMLLTNAPNFLCQHKWFHDLECYLGFDSH